MSRLESPQLPALKDARDIHQRHRSIDRVTAETAAQQVSLSSLSDRNVFVYERLFQMRQPCGTR